MQRTSILFYFILPIIAIFLSRCANPVSPQGGPKDTKPPMVISCEPSSHSIYFSKPDFKVNFNEFITLKNPISEIYISPQLKKPLDTKLRGKSLIINFEDSLSPNTTYSITFGNAISDLTESNVLKSFNYVFSTGSYIDSLSIQGTLVSAFDHTPQKDAFIGIYLDNNDTLAFDSLPFHVPPYYITRTDEKGLFIFNNLQKTKCKIFALADQNGDLIFNQPTEKIAFLDSLVDPFYMIKLEPDTLSPPDSVKKPDSLTLSPISYPTISLFMFQETDSAQRILKSSLPDETMALLVFRYPVENLQLTPLNFDSLAPWYIPEYSKNRDSVTLWITRPETDSITLKVVADKIIPDTLDLAIPFKEKREKKNVKISENQLRIIQPSRGTGFNQYKNKMSLTWSSPLKKVDFSRVLLIADKDTSHPSIVYADSMHRKIRVDHLWQEEKGYTLLFPDSTFFGINGISQDTINFGFRTKAEKDFGNLILTFNLPSFQGNYLIQLMNEKESVIYEQFTVNGPHKVKFEFMTPGKYKIKAIKDRNKNGAWDSGNYKYMIQPEEVIYLPKIIEIRSNWDVEETWD